MWVYVPAVGLPAVAALTLVAEPVVTPPGPMTVNVAGLVEVVVASM